MGDDVDELGRDFDTADFTYALSTAISECIDGWEADYEGELHPAEIAGVLDAYKHRLLQDTML